MITVDLRILGKNLRLIGLKYKNDFVYTLSNIYLDFMVDLIHDKEV